MTSWKPPLTFLLKMKLHIALVACCVLFLTIAAADSSPRGRISGTLKVHGAGKLPRDGIEVHLAGGKYVTYATQDGYFEFDDVPQGVYALTVVSHEYSLPRALSVELYPTTNGGSKLSAVLTLADDPRERQDVLDVLLVPKVYLEERRGFQVTDLLKNPTMLIMGFMTIVGVGLPKCMNSIDPDAVKEMQAANAPDPKDPRGREISASSTQFFGAGKMASTGPPSRSPEAITAQ